MKIPAAKAAVDKEREKLAKIPPWKLTKVTSEKEVIDEARTNDAQVHFASLMDMCHLKKAELETQHQKLGRLSCTTRWFCERRFRSLCSIQRKRVISITNDSSQCHGDHIQIARVRRTSSWRSIGLHPSKNGRCSQIIENSKIGVSRHLDSSTTTQVAKIMVQYGRPSRSSWAKSVRSPFGRTYGKGKLRKSHWSTVVRRFSIGNAYSNTVKKGDWNESGIVLSRNFVMESLCTSFWGRRCQFLAPPSSTVVESVCLPGSCSTSSSVSCNEKFGTRYRHDKRISRTRRAEIGARSVQQCLNPRTAVAAAATAEGVNRHCNGISGWVRGSFRKS